MDRTSMIRVAARSFLLVLVALVTVGTASAQVSGGSPPGKLCGSVTGAAWKFQGQSGTRYDVTANSGRSCATAMKSVSGLTKQKAHAGVLGLHTLVGPRGFRCLGSGILKPASAGFCGGSNGARFFWGPRLKH